MENIDDENDLVKELEKNEAGSIVDTQIFIEQNIVIEMVVISEEYEEIEELHTIEEVKAIEMSKAILDRNTSTSTETIENTDNNLN